MSFKTEYTKLEMISKAIGPMDRLKQSLESSMSILRTLTTEPLQRVCCSCIRLQKKMGVGNVRTFCKNLRTFDGAFLSEVSNHFGPFSD